MEKHSKNLKNIKVEKDSLQATLKETYANYWNFKANKDIMSVKHIVNFRKTTRIWSRLS
jgi:hypothetical protein